MGSAALNMCMIAKGAGDINYEYGIHCWDVAAGAVIVREAGGYVCDPAGTRSLPYYSISIHVDAEL